MSSRIGYYRRVSSDRQDTASQDHVVGEWLAARGWSDARVFSDEGISGATEQRPGYQALRAAVAAGEIDTVVCFRLDRISRNATAAMRLLTDWLQSDVSFYAVDQPILSLGKDNPFRLTFLAMMAEISQIERQTLVARVKAGLAAARARGVKLGGTPKLTSDEVIAMRKARSGGASYKQLARQFRVSASTAHKACTGATEP